MEKPLRIPIFFVLGTANKLQNRSPVVAIQQRESGSVSVRHYARKVPLEDRNKLEAWGFIVKCLPEVGSMGTRHSPIYYSLGCE